MLEFRYLLNNWDEDLLHRNIALVRSNLTRNLGAFIPDMADEAAVCLREEITPPDGGWSGGVSMNI